MRVDESVDFIVGAHTGTNKNNCYIIPGDSQLRSYKYLTY